MATNIKHAFKYKVVSEANFAKGNSIARKKVITEISSDDTAEHLFQCKETLQTLIKDDLDRQGRLIIGDIEIKSIIPITGFRG